MNKVKRIETTLQDLLHQASEVQAATYRSLTGKGIAGIDDRAWEGLSLERLTEEQDQLFEMIQSETDEAVAYVSGLQETIRMKVRSSGKKKSTYTSVESMRDNFLDVLKKGNGAFVSNELLATYLNHLEAHVQNWEDSTANSDASILMIEGERIVNTLYANLEIFKSQMESLEESHSAIKDAYKSPFKFNQGIDRMAKDLAKSLNYLDNTLGKGMEAREVYPVGMCPEPGGNSYVRIIKRGHKKKTRAAVTALVLLSFGAGVVTGEYVEDAYRTAVDRIEKSYREIIAR